MRIREQYPHFSGRGEHEEFKVVKRTFYFLVQFDGATLGEAVGLVAVRAVHPLGTCCDELEVPLALAAA